MARLIYISHTPLLSPFRNFLLLPRISYPHFIARRVGSIFVHEYLPETSGNFRKLRFPFYPPFFFFLYPLPLFPSVSPIFLNFLPSLSFPFSARISYIFSQFFRKVCANQAPFLDVVSKAIPLSIRLLCTETLIKDGRRKKVSRVSARWLTYQRCKTKARGRRVTNFPRFRTLTFNFRSTVWMRIPSRQRGKFLLPLRLISFESRSTMEHNAHCSTPSHVIRNRGRRMCVSPRA